MALKKDIDIPTFVCNRCGKKYQTLSSFPTNNSLVYSMDGHIPVCNTCLRDIWHKFYNYFGSARTATKRTCMAFDFYYNEKLFQSVYDENNDSKYIFREYVQRTSLRQFQGRTFDNSIQEGEAFTTDDANALLDKIRQRQEENESYVDDDEIPQDIIDFWGEGFESSQYRLLDKHYKFIRETNPNCDSNQELFINDLCKIYMLKEEALRNGSADEFNKLSENYRKTFIQAGLKATKDNSTMEDFKLGVTAETIEMYTPSEYYKNKKLYKDFDGIGDYFKRIVMRPLKNLQFGTDDRDEEYSVKDDG